MRNTIECRSSPGTCAEMRFDFFQMLLTQKLRVLCRDKRAFAGNGIKEAFLFRLVICAFGR